MLHAPMMCLCFRCALPPHEPLQLLQECLVVCVVAGLSTLIILAGQAQQQVCCCLLLLALLAPLPVRLNLGLLRSIASEGQTFRQQDMTPERLHARAVCAQLSRSGDDDGPQHQAWDAGPLGPAQLMSPPPGVGQSFRRCSQLSTPRLAEPS